MPEEPKKGLGNLAIRLLTAAVMVPVILWLLYGAPLLGFRALATLVALVSASELMLMTQQGRRDLVVWGVFTTIALYSTLLYFDDPRAHSTAMIAVVITSLVVSVVRPDPIESAGTRTGWLVGGPFYIALLAFIPRLHELALGGSWVVLSMMFAWFSDTGGYFAGRAFGKHKLHERVSPKKTIEGAIGGLGGAVFGAVLAHFWFLRALPLVDGIVLALVAGALGQVGDLAESLIKRSTGVKDSGTIVPGHGGLLDRVDALLFTGAVTWVYATWIFPHR